MSIDIKNINEVTFTQSFRGYSTDEVDSFLDELYEEAVKNNDEIQELKKRIEDLEAGGGGASDADAYAVISNAQEESDKLIEQARRKAHEMIESAQNAGTAPTSLDGLDSVLLGKLKEIIRETYEKQMSALEGFAQEDKIQLPEIHTEPDDIPSITFEGLTKSRAKIPAERDILGEIGAIGFGDIDSQDSEEDSHPDEQEEDLAFTFADNEEEKAEQLEVSSQENEPEDPDDIIAQILRDNNRN